MQATETLRAPQDIAYASRSDSPQATHPQSTREQTLQVRQDREATIYRWVVGTWMVLLIGFGIVQLMGVIRV
jgi:hypothetical protein